MYLMVFVTVSSKEEAKKIASGLLEHKLVACVNIVDKIESYFWWEGKIDSASELLLIAKTQEDKFEKIEKLVKSLHSYDVPEIVAIPITFGHKPYFNWINESLR